MKQYITPEDIQQLSKEVQSKYLQAFSSKDGSGLIGNISGKIIHPLVSIGQMIEFLSQYGSINMGLWDEGWMLTYKATMGTTKPQAELCDALWEATKEVLGKEIQ